MPIAVLVLALVAYGAALVAYPGFRRWGIAGGLVAAAGLGFYLAREAPEAVRAGDAHRRLGARPRPGRGGADGAGRDADRRGSTTARTAYRLRDLTLALRLRDCPAEDTAPDDLPGHRRGDGHRPAGRAARADPRALGALRLLQPAAGRGHPALGLADHRRPARPAAPSSCRAAAAGCAGRRSPPRGRRASSARARRRASAAASSCRPAARPR